MTLIFRAEDHTYWKDGFEKPSVTQIISECGLTDFSCVPPEIMRKAQNFGTAVHTLTEYEDKGTLDYESISNPLIPYLEAWQKFKKEHKFEYTEIEKKFYCEKFGFCGTIDRIGRTATKRIILDIKTSTSMSPTTALQLAGYALGINETNIARWGVQLKADGNYSIFVYDTSTDVPMFLSVLNVWKWKKQNNLLKRKK